MSQWCDHEKRVGTCLVCYQALLDKCAALAAENDLLRKVAEVVTSLFSERGVESSLDHFVTYSIACDAINDWHDSQVKG